MSTDQRWGWDSFVPVALDALEAVLGSPISSISEADHLMDDIGLDSFGLLLFVTELEERLAIELPASHDEPLAGNVCRLVAAALSDAAVPR